MANGSRRSPTSATSTDSSAHGCRARSPPPSERRAAASAPEPPASRRKVARVPGHTLGRNSTPPRLKSRRFGCPTWHRRCFSAPRHLANTNERWVGCHPGGPMDQQKVEALATRIVGDMAASFSMALGHIGDRLGLFRAMKGAGPVTSAQLAAKTALNERYVREWLKAMAASEYLDYDPTSDTYVMTAEQAYVLADDASPMSAGGPLQFTAPTVANTEKLLRIFRDGGGISYSEIGPEVPEGIARFFGPGYVNFLVQECCRPCPVFPSGSRRGSRWPTSAAATGCRR